MLLLGKELVDKGLVAVRSLDSQAGFRSSSSSPPLPGLHHPARSSAGRRELIQAPAFCFPISLLIVPPSGRFSRASLAASDCLLLLDADRCARPRGSLARPALALDSPRSLQPYARRRPVRPSSFDAAPVLRLSEGAPEVLWHRPDDGASRARPAVDPPPGKGRGPVRGPRRRPDGLPFVDDHLGPAAPDAGHRPARRARAARGRDGRRAERQAAGCGRLGPPVARRERAPRQDERRHPDADRHRHLAWSPVRLPSSSEPLCSPDPGADPASCSCHALPPTGTGSASRSRPAPSTMPRRHSGSTSPSGTFRRASARRAPGLGSTD